MSRARFRVGRVGGWATSRRWRRAGASVLLVAFALVSLLGATQAAPASSSPGGSGHPLQVRSASLTQHGQQLVWRVTLEHAFAPKSLAPAGRSLCLLLERSNASVRGQLCVAGPPPGGRSPRVLYQEVTARGPQRPQAVDATISRSGDSELTAEFVPAAVRLGWSSTRWQVISTLRPPACTPPTPSRAGCYVLFPARPHVAALHVPVLVGCIPSGPAEVFHGSPSRREIALTFDDGPWNDPPTPAFLDVLEREHAVATFFEIGNQISTYDPHGTYERRMLADGDFIGDHTWSHPDMAQQAPDEQRRQLVSALDAIRQATGGLRTCLWRPPYGAVSSSLVALARSLGLLTIQWDIDPRSTGPVPEPAPSMPTSSAMPTTAGS